MAQARPSGGQRKNEDLRQRETERRLIELRLERAVYRVLFFAAAILLCLYAMLYAEMHNRCMSMRKRNLSSLLV